MKTLFHIGMPKTGSTALQNALWASADYLQTKGILYPRDPERPKLNNHRIFGTQLAPLEALPRSLARFGSPEETLAHFVKFRKHIRHEVDTHRPELLLLSAEDMFKFIRKSFRAKIFAAFDTIGSAPHFVAYLRRPSHRYVSALQQLLRASEGVQQPRSPNSSKVLGAYADLFGKDRVMTHLYERSALHGGDVVADFTQGYLAIHGVSFDKLTKVGEVNVSVGAEAMKIMQAFRRTFHGGMDNKLSRDSTQLLAALLSADSAVGAQRPRLRPRIADFVDYGSTDPLVLRDRHGIVFSDFDYRRLEAGRLVEPPIMPLSLQEIIVIDPKMEEAVVEHLMASEWARAPRRANWLAQMRQEADT